MMAMAQPPCPEFTIICIDNGQRALCCKGIYHAQLKGARYYCETVLKSSPDSMVSIFTMSSKKYGELVPPTNDLQRLLRALKYLHLMQASSYGQKLNESSVALDVFNFCLLKLLNENATILQGNYHYARTELEKLVTVANANGNSRIVDIVDEYESSVIGALSESTLQEHVHHLNQKAAADDEKNSLSAEAEAEAKENIAL